MVVRVQNEAMEGLSRPPLPLKRTSFHSFEYLLVLDRRRNNLGRVFGERITLRFQCTLRRSRLDSRHNMYMRKAATCARLMKWIQNILWLWWEFQPIADDNGQ